MPGPPVSVPLSVAPLVYEVTLDCGRGRGLPTRNYSDTDRDLLPTTQIYTHSILDTLPLAARQISRYLSLFFFIAAPRLLALKHLDLWKAVASELLLNQPLTVLTLNVPG